MPIILSNPFFTISRAKKKRIDPFYQSRAWRVTRLFVIQRDKGFCRYCPDSAHAGAGMVVDHYLPRKKFPGLELDESNLFYCCMPCHIRKTAVEQLHPKSGDFQEWLTAHGFAKPTIW